MQLLLILALFPLGLALLASRARYATATRRSAGGAVETRYVEAPAPPIPAAATRAALAVLGGTVALLVLLAILRLDAVPPTSDVLFLFGTLGLIVALSILARPTAWAGGVALGVLVAAFAYWISAWYICVAIGLAIAACSVSRRAMVPILALVLLAATVPGYTTSVPFETVGEQVRDLVPPGAVVGVAGPIVYVAAVMPSGVTLR
jgi:hypothetical protein